MDESVSETLLSTGEKSSGEDNEDTYTVEDAINAYGIGVANMLNLILCGLYWSADACEMMIMSFLLPAVKKDLGIDSGVESLLASVVFLGIAIGSFGCGYIADRIGRRPVVCVTALLSGVLGAVSALSSSIELLLFVRFVLGLALGGAPVAFALALESIPARLRGRAMIYYSLFWTFGSIFEALLAYYVMPHLGWRYLLALSSIPCVLVGVVSYPLLTESPRYLFAKGDKFGAVQVLNKIARMNKRTPLTGELVKAGDAIASSRPWASFLLLSPTFRRNTLCVWALWIINSFAYYGLALFTTEYFESIINGDALQSTLITTSAELPAIILIAVVMKYTQRRILQILTLLICGVALLCLLFPELSRMPYALICSFFARGAIASSYAVLYIYTPELYSTTIRSSALGSAAAIAKLASIVTPFVSNGLQNRSIAIALYGSSCLIGAVLACFITLDRGDRALIETVEGDKYFVTIFV